MVEILEENGQLIIRIGGQEYTRYQFGPPRWKPYLYPLRASNGLSLLADAPTDHRHHHGFWVGHGRVDENDFWLERHNSGKIVHVQFAEIVNGEQSGHFTAQNDWVAPDGEALQPSQGQRPDHRPMPGRIERFHAAASGRRLTKTETASSRVGSATCRDRF